MHTGLTASSPARLILLAILAASVGALGLAYTAEHAFGLEPCALCIYQRVPYVIAGVLAAVALGLSADRRSQARLVGLCGGVFLVGLGLAAYHVGVEQHWWASPVCGGSPAADMTLEEMQAELTAKPSRPCDRVDWTLFGLSIAGYNGIASLGFAAFSLAGARLLLRRRTG